MVSKQAKILGNVYKGAAGSVARVFDRLVGVVAPGMAHSMLKRRMQHSALLSYEAARVDRMMPGEATVSPDAELLHDLPVIRARSRRQVQDDAHASSAVQVYVDAVIGGDAARLLDARIGYLACRYQDRAEGKHRAQRGCGREVAQAVSHLLRRVVRRSRRCQRERFVLRLAGTGCAHAQG